MRPLAVLAILALFGAPSGAEVVRCTNAAGSVSYTDGACPAGTRQAGRVPIQEPAAPSPDEVEQRRQAQIDKAEQANRRQRESTEALARQPVPAGPAIIDSRGNTRDERSSDSRWSERGTDPVILDDGYAYPGAYRRPSPPRDMRPRIRDCDASGCRDTQGNQYNRAGQLDRYRSLDGKTCRPVGTTTICR